MGADRNFEAPAEIPLGPRVPVSRSEANLSVVRSLPIVDIHVHTFNARYLPLEHILLAKRDVHPLGALLTDARAIRTARLISEIAPLTPVPQVSQPPNGAPRPADLDENELEMQIGLKRICRRCNGESVEDPATLTEGENAVTDEMQKVLGPLFGLVLGVKSARQFLNRLVTADGNLEAAYQKAYAQDGAGQPRIDLFVSQAMDLAPSYDQVGETKTWLLDFPSQQLPRMAARQLSAGSRMIWFVGYSPFRSPLGEDHLATVKKAIREHAAYGVKLYPPDGYRPSLNRIPERPNPPGSSEPGQYWDARYQWAAGPDAIRDRDPRGVGPKELDRRLDDLASYCEENDLPILVHTGHGELEARKGHGACMANPDFWIPVLEKHPNLRLCLGHAGGQEYWFGIDDEFSTWGRRVADLCTSYKNVYCGFGIHDAFARGPDRKEDFIRRIDGLIRGQRGAYPIQSKLLYGSDWFMPRAGGSEVEILEGFQDAFADDRLFPFAAAFFATNALHFLDLGHRAQLAQSGDGSEAAHLGTQLSKRLRETSRRIHSALSPPQADN